MKNTLTMWYPEECPMHEQASGPVTTNDNWQTATYASVRYKCGCTLRITGRFFRRYNRKVRA